MTPRLSVIVPTWNEVEYLPRLLVSLREQTVKELEVIVADSGSTDGTERLAREAGAIVVNGERRGPAEGRNRGAKAAQGDVLVFADADCILPPNLLAEVLTALRDPAVVGGCTAFAPSEGTQWDRLLLWTGSALQRAMTAMGFPHCAGTCFFYRRSAFEKLGGLREDMSMNEDHDLALRSRALGRFACLSVVVETSMRRYRAYGYARTLLREYLASTIFYYITGQSPSTRFRPMPAR